MTWKDLFTEFMLKLGVKINRKPRKVKIARNTIGEFMTNAQVIKGRNERDFEDRLVKRSKITPYLRTDDKLYEPYADLITLVTIGRENFSFALEIGKAILRSTLKFENDHGVKINKSHLYFGLALNAIYLNDTINAMIYWELSQEEESNTLGMAYSAQTALNNALNSFSSVINPINLSIKENSLYNGAKENYNCIEEFSAVLRKQHSPELFAYFSSALRYRQIDYWLKNDFTAMTKNYSQELVNSLCILCEANLKDYPVVTETMLGPIINNNLSLISVNVSTIVGKSNPPSGLFVTFPTKSELEFNTNFPLLVNSIKTNTLSEDSLKAHLIYGAYMLRNKALHDFNPLLIYYSNKMLFQDTIGLLFGAVSAIKNL